MATRELTRCALQAKEMRQQLKQSGIKASVRARNFAGGSAIDVRVISGSYKKAKEIAGQFEKISYCHASGEILSGSNRYIHVELDREIVEAKEAELLPAVNAAVEEANTLTGSQCADIKGHDGCHVGKEGYGWGLWMNGTHVLSYPCRDAKEVAYHMAHKLLSST